MAYAVSLFSLGFFGANSGALLGPHTLRLHALRLDVVKLHVVKLHTRKPRCEISRFRVLVQRHRSVVRCLFVRAHALRQSRFNKWIQGAI